MKRLPFVWGAWLSGAVALTLPQTAAATVMLRLETPAAVARSQQIVLGDVLRQRVLKMDGQLWTESLLRVRVTYKGSARPGAVLAVRQLGGELGQLGLRVAGVATFAARERALVYLRRVGSYYVVVGMAQGKYRVFRDGAGVWRAARDLSGIAFAQRDARGRTVIVPPASVLGAPARKLAAVVAELRAALARQGAARRGLR